MHQSASAPSLHPSTSYASLRSTLRSTSTSASSKPYLGPLKHQVPRLTTVSAVDFERGGSDFRCPIGPRTSSLGKQVLAWPHTKTAGRYRFAESKRFAPEKYRSPGPKFPPVSSLGKQVASRRPSHHGSGFGTSSRNDCLKQYAIYTTRR